MKVVNKIMIGIAVLCLLLCGGILVFALNPDMTSSLAQKLYGNTVDMPPGTEETGEGQTSGNGNISVTLPNGMPGEMNGYVAPSMDQMQIPEEKITEEEVRVFRSMMQKSRLFKKQMSMRGKGGHAYKRR